MRSFLPMKLDRKEILKALESISIAGEGQNMVESGAVQNVVVFGNEVVVDLVIHSPAMHTKKTCRRRHQKINTRTISSGDCRKNKY